MPSGYKHGDTPQKAMVRGTISYLESQGLPVNKSAIFRHFDLSRSQGYAALSVPSSRRNDPEWEETRGRPSKISEPDQKKMESILWDDAYDDANLNWSRLAKEAGLETECNPRTLHRTMGTLSYRRCLACARCWTHKKLREKRVEFARKMLDAYPDPLDWRSVRFSAELHFGFASDRKLRLVPRAGERFCPGCVALPEASWPRDVKRVHAWVAVGYGFKSEIVFYEDSLSPNGSGVMTMPQYRDKILQKAVKPWLANPGPQGFVLEEDADLFAHGSGSKVNLVQHWKEDNGLRCHFSCGESPDLSPLDSLWPARKQWELDSAPADWEDETLRGVVRGVWEGFEQERVDVWVDFMQQRLRQVVDTEGRFVGW